MDECFLPVMKDTSGMEPDGRNCSANVRLVEEESKNICAWALGPSSLLWIELCSPKDRPISLEPVSVILLGNGMFADVIQLK